MGEEQRPPTLDYLSPALPAWPPVNRSPFSVVWPYSAGCSGGFFISFFGEDLFSGAMHGRRVFDDMCCVGGFFIVGWFYLAVLTAIAVGIRGGLSSRVLAAVHRPRPIFIGLIAGVFCAATAYTFGRYAYRFDYAAVVALFGLPGLAAITAAVVLVRPAPPGPFTDPRLR